MKHISPHIFSWLLAALSVPLSAHPRQETALCEDSCAEVLHSTMAGAGVSNVLDTYLSPYNYTGADFRVQRETMRMTRLWKGKVASQTLFDFDVAVNKNRKGNFHEYAGGIRYSQAWLHTFNIGKVDGAMSQTASERKDFPPGRRQTPGTWAGAAGLAVSGYLGGVYIDRSGNNPAQAKADVTIDATAMATYAMRAGRQTLLWRYQVFVPLAGVAFSPRFGQSYYELFGLGHYDRNVVFAHPLNAPSMRHRLTLDIPVGRHTVRVGYVGQFQQSTFHQLKYHSYSHNFMIGFNKYFYRR